MGKSRALFDSLTLKQREVCQLMAKGLLNKQIADQLGVSINTIKTHRTEIFRKMGARSLLDLARMMDLLDHEESASAGSTHPEATVLSSTDTASPPRILVVEDNPILLQVMTTILTNLGYEAWGLPDGEALDEALASGPVDVTLLDICLGEDREDGYALAARLRQRSRCGIIMTTALGRREDRIHGLDEGADAYLVKPIDFEELDATIRSVLRRLRQAKV